VSGRRRRRHDWLRFWNPLSPWSPSLPSPSLPLSRESLL